jgi:hypothetical protein
MIVRDVKDRCIAVEVIDSINTILKPSIRLCPSYPTIPFKLCRGRFPIKIAFAMAINKAQGQALVMVSPYDK